MADHLPSTMFGYADAHTPVEFPSMYLINESTVCREAQVV